MTAHYKQSEFTGASRIQLVEDLFELYETKRDEGAKGPIQPVWVSLEAPPGWGKTRVGQELYKRLAANQEYEPHYWPDEIDITTRHSERVDTTVFVHNKETYPRLFLREAGSLPEFLWLGIACSARGGSSSQAWREDIQQLESHLLFLGAQRHHNTSFKDRMVDAFARNRNKIAKMSLNELSSYALNVLECSFPGMGTATELAKSTVQSIKNRVEEKKAVGEETLIIIPSKSNEVQYVVDFVEDLGQHRIPVVVFVEDLHNADGMLYEFISELMKRKGAIMVVSTIWPEKITESATIQRMFDKFSDRLVRESLMKLEPEARKELLQHHYPEIDEATAEMLSVRFVSPLALEAFCHIKRFRRSFPVLRLEPDEVEDLPSNLNGLYTLLWTELSVPEKATLAVAWYLSPESINKTEGSGDRRWSHPILCDVMTRLPIDEEYRDTVVEGLDATDTPGAWIQAIDKYLRAFLEPLHDQVVAANGPKWLLDELLTKPDVEEQILQALVARMDDISDSDPIDTYRGRAILALHRSKRMDKPQAAARAIDALLGRLVDSPREFAERDRLWELYNGLNPNEISDEIRFSICRRHAARLVEERRTDKAIEIYSALSEEMGRSEAFGPHHRVTLDVQHDMAVCLCDMGRYVEGTPLLRSVIDRMHKNSEMPKAVVLKAEMSLAFQRGDANGYDRALKALVSESKEEDLSVIDAWEGLVWLYSNSQQRERALDECKKLHTYVEQTFSELHPRTLRIRGNKATLLEFMKRYDEAISLNSSLRTDMEQVLNKDHREVLELRAKLAYQLYCDGRFSAALAECDELLADLTRVLGSDSPTHHMVERYRVNALISLDRSAEAITASKELLSRILDSPGADDEMGEIAWNWHTRALWRAGDHEAAIDALKKTMNLSRAILGLDHRYLCFLRRDLVNYLHEAGHLDEALSESRRLVDHACDTLDPDDEIIAEVVEQKERLEALQTP